jgi:hypothetical protein
MVGIYKTEIEQNKIEIDEESMAEPELLESGHNFRKRKIHM